MSTLNKIKVISFDMDSTLCDFNAVMIKALTSTINEIAKQNPKAASKLTVQKLISIRNEVEKKVGPGVSHEEIRKTAFREALESVQVFDETFVEQIYSHYMKERFSNIVLYPDVVSVLEQLRHKYRLGVVTNGNSYPEKMGLGEYFDFALFSQDIGIRKPDPRIFYEALKLASCTSEELLHVGDSERDDVKGAFNAGVSSVLLNRTGKTVDSNSDYVVSSMFELAEMLL